MTKKILVTGGSRGIGRATALQCGALGWSVGVGHRQSTEEAATVVRAVASGIFVIHS